MSDKLQPHEFRDPTANAKVQPLGQKVKPESMTTVPSTETRGKGSSSSTSMKVESASHK